MYACMFVGRQVGEDANLHVCVYIYMYIYMYAYVYLSICTCSHTCVCPHVYRYTLHTYVDVLRRMIRTKR